MFGTKSLFGNTTTSTPFSTTQQVTQSAQNAQSVAQICADTNVLLKSLCGPELFNDEKDRVVARLNQVQVGLGIGSGYYANDKPAVDYNAKNIFHRFKGVVYNKISEASDDDGICGLILNVPYNQIADAAQQSNLASKVDDIIGQKQAVNTIVERVKPVDNAQTEVLIHVFEKGMGKVRATHLFKFLSQPDKMKALETQLKCTKIVPLVSLSSDSKEKYLNNAPDGFSPQLWLQGVRSNPHPNNFLPAPVYGFDQLLERHKMQKVSDTALQTSLGHADEKRENLEKAINWDVSKVKALANAHKELSHRLLRIACAILKDSRQGYGLAQREDKLSASAEQCNAMLFSPNALKDRINAIFTLLESDQDKLKEYFGMIDLRLTEDEASEAKFCLSSVQNKLEKMRSLQTKDAKDLQVIESKEMSRQNPIGIDKLAALRISYLEQSAALLAKIGDTPSDFYSKLSSHMMTELKEYKYVEQIKTDQTISRSRCKQCRHYFVSKDNGTMSVKVTKQKKRIVRTCLNCNHQVSYLHNPSYKSRNEKK
ncbi:unnamed protein product [Bursaphelenchus okinawaensis]|uniref:Nucleoporin Nup54 alpha-helical domain-containing protein n=1 Tax=Bursaphelenchus okinawaensis TaxID=465554 RepID=A0A811JUY3_9BILA|nr:unnamed protein product [Bursaphelenchus okinawaensis]CAG9083609.1 unnamed protein product [Bursaphelenchus okinawaensis]